MPQSRGSQPLGYTRVLVSGLLKAGRTTRGERSVSSEFIAVLVAGVSIFTLPPVRSAWALDSHRSPNPTGDRTRGKPASFASPESLVQTILTPRSREKLSSIKLVPGDK